MHTRREIDNLLDKISEIIAKNKKSNKDNTELQKLIDEINIKTDDGKRAKGMWTESPEFNYTKL
jgi:peptidoglycan hydrolase CwlO-like protein